ncbi:MAG: hypothetical protein ACYCS0_08355 [bacterium]|jgi:hypothetical protein
MTDSIIYKTFKICDLFDFPPTNSNITKEFCNINIGNIPVYGSSKDQDAVFVNGNLKVHHIGGVKMHQ